MLRMTRLGLPKASPGLSPLPNAPGLFGTPVKLSRSHLEMH